MKLIRLVLGKLILFFDALFSPKPISRPPEKQAEIDRATASLALYQFHACPFCVKVRRAIRRLNLKIELRDAQVPSIADELAKGGGSLQVPCLRIVEAGGKTRWLYESSDINAYLEQNFGPSRA